MYYEEEKRKKWIPTLYHTQNELQVDYKPKCQKKSSEL